jgi:hypothetical protein
MYNDVIYVIGTAYPTPRTWIGYSFYFIDIIVDVGIG